ncbi:MAG: AbrB/MazE/SpoVT family DNA-binding domain-containing protein [Asgard group archaeon]|nr:AbrB/MazE/SpoVT family DNA-binding domain-containing protein [Asgard group archaeon]
MKFLGSATITGKNQITIPRRVIEEMDLEVGEALIFLQDKEGHVFLTTEVALPE